MLAARAGDRSLAQVMPQVKKKKKRKKLAEKYLKNFKLVEAIPRQSTKPCAYTGDVFALAGNATILKSSGRNCYPLRSNTVKMSILHTLRVVLYVS